MPHLTLINIFRRVLVKKLLRNSLAKSLFSYSMFILGYRPKDFRRDFVAMAFLGALRGNNIDAIRNKSQPEIITFVNNMVSAYGLSKNRIDKNGATLSRFAIACSPDVCRLYKLHDIKPVIDLPSEIDGFPNHICFSTFGSLIPTKAPGSELLKLAFLYHQIRLDKVLNSKKKDYKEAIKDKSWKGAILDELRSLEKYDTWTEIRVPKSKEVIETRWIFKIKENGTKKARLVAKGYQINKDDPLDVLGGNRFGGFAS